METSKKDLHLLPLREKQSVFKTKILIKNIFAEKTKFSIFADP
ncbi:hypothetical protein ADIARSV_0082 [Arcticibacter svalbardensis MN12-7]|uniref:Uncharacterized protein n=1 Tax=Arcticibacter svalbardensis MN12-7 TaxID=1150600 RepID=R9H698_9SPHI|nr:hypothetical protein ADIARSV_0082 [Arcticibacter svalbardensis MN12-7]